ncbi:MAG: hypothetical protein DWQ40_10530 [Actinobacteria bacterium]|nr:MAG: hypothetical protein DWQ40_10530 [Actinomycetota bacterium]REK40208.1 MAG: hypothetical protein DWQ20_02335 [Actinomycetota bacterium]
MWLIRIAIVALVLAAVGIAVVPILVMLDLLNGGSGWGLCPGGLEACDKPYTTPFEFLIVLILGLFLVILAIRLVARLARRLQAESYQVNEQESQLRRG